MPVGNEGVLKSMQRWKITLNHPNIITRKYRKSFVLENFLGVLKN